MLKKYLLVFQLVLLCSIALIAQTPKHFTTFIPTKNFSFNLKTTNDFVFNGSVNPQINLSVTNNRMDPMPITINCLIQTEDGLNKYFLSQQSTINSLDSTLFSFYFYAPTPGFYKVKLDADGDLIKEFNICYNPSMVDYKYYPDKGIEFYWQMLRKKNNLKGADYKVTKIKENRVRPRDAYKVDMKFTNGEIFTGYLFVPVTDPANAIVRTKMEYGKDVDVTQYKNYWENCIDFVFSIDSVSRPDSLFFTNTIYKYSAVLDYLLTRKDTKDKRMFVVGNGFSGGLAIIAAIADKRFSAVSVYNPYINDIFLGESSNFKMPRFIKSLTVPVLFGMGLQDNIAIPRTLFESYNAIRGQKEYYIYPLSGQLEQQSWDTLQNNFLMKFF